MDIVSILLEFIGGLWENIFQKQFVELTIPQIWIALAVTLGVVYLIKIILGVSKKGTVVILNGAKGGLKLFSAKYRASKVTCLHCGRTLDKCVCPSNKDAKYSKRLRRHSLELKALKAAKKAKLVK
jgi:hypothetical protein